MTWWTERLLRARLPEGERFLFRRRSVPAVDWSYGDERLAAIRGAAREDGAARWAGIREQLAAAEDGEDLTFLLDGLRNLAGVERWTPLVLDTHPEDPFALLVSGARHVGWAWHARTGSDTPTPAEATGSEEQLPASLRAVFRSRLETAERHLARAAELAPASPAPWYFLQASGHGLDLGPEIAERRFAAVTERAPGHLAAHRQRLRQLSPAAGGPYEPAHAFARDALLAAPAGSPLGELVALAHLDHWLDLGGDPDSVYLTSTSVLDSLHEAAARSVLHPDFAQRRDWPLTVNAFAMAFCLAGDQPTARHLFRILGDRPTEIPWRYLDPRSPVVPFLAWRSRVTR